jgi:hypothetical protein
MIAAARIEPIIRLARLFNGTSHPRHVRFFHLYEKSRPEGRLLSRGAEDCPISPSMAHAPV